MSEGRQLHPTCRVWGRGATNPLIEGWWDEGNLPSFLLRMKASTFLLLLVFDYFLSLQIYDSLRETLPNNLKEMYIFNNRSSSKNKTINYRNFLKSTIINVKCHLTCEIHIFSLTFLTIIYYSSINLRTQTLILRNSKILQDTWHTMR